MPSIPTRKEPDLLWKSHNWSQNNKKNRNSRSNHDTEVISIPSTNKMFDANIPAHFHW
jgi:hypothetical protein